MDFRFEGTRYRKKSPENSQAGARAYEALLRSRLAKGESPDQHKKEVKTFAEFSQEWFETYVKTNNKPSEQMTKEQLLRLHLVPFFGRSPLRSIDSHSIESFKARQLKHGYSRKTVNNHLSALRRCLSHAVEWGRLDTLPLVKWLSTTPPTFDFLSEPECELLLSDMTEPSWRPMLITARFTGMRVGELLALDWSDVDLKRRQIAVSRALYKGVISSTKTHRVRHLPMATVVAEAFASLPHKTGFVFSQNGGASPVTARAAGCAIERFCRRARIRRIGWHVLRHTFASHLVAKGTPIRTVQALMGHSTIAMTERYSHLSNADLRTAVDSLEPTADPAIHGHYMVNAATVSTAPRYEPVQILANHSKKTAPMGRP